jgi:nucleotide-binding universal stress UspA family protein
MLCSIRSILAPLDGSTFAEQAIPLAESIARATGAALHLFRVVPPLADYYFWAPMPGDPLEHELRESHRREAFTYLKEVSGRLHAEAVDCDVMEEDESITDSIGAEIEKTGADLVVLASHGRGAVQRFWLGSVADKLMRTLNLPILLVRPREHPEPVDLSELVPVKHVLLALDGSAEAERILEPALAIGTAMNADFTLVRAISSSGEGGAAERRKAVDYLEGVANRLRAGGAVVRTCVHAGDPAAALMEEAAANGADLIALETHGRGGLSRLVLGSVADKVVQASTVPVLLCRMPPA